MRVENEFRTWICSLLISCLSVTATATLRAQATGMSQADSASTALRSGDPSEPARLPISFHRMARQLNRADNQRSPYQLTSAPEDVNLEGTGTAGDFPPLPPDPYEQNEIRLPPLDQELWAHGGSYLYTPEGDRLNWPDHDEAAHFDVLRVPEDWIQPKPCSAFSEFLGADPIHSHPALKWPGAAGYMWDTRFVGYGRWSLFGLAFEQDKQRQDALGQQLLVDLDLRLTGTERFHVQFRPLGRDGSGGSYYQFNQPSGFVNNTTGEPQRYWFEGELASLLGSFVSPFAALDYNFAVGRVPFALQNNLLINDEFLGAVVAKNNLFLGTTSNINLRAFCGWNDISAFGLADGQLYGLSLEADRRATFYEFNYVFLQHEYDSNRDAHFAAFGGTQLRGPVTVTGRALFKWGDVGGSGDGQLYVLESNLTRTFEHHCLHVEQAVFYCNAFLATAGWNSIAGGNFNRLRTSFETNPLIRIAAGIAPDDNWGVALGVQLFRHHMDGSWVPEIAFESPQGESVFGCGVRYLRKVGSRTYFESLFNVTRSDDSRFDREGVFLSYHILF